MTTADEMGLFRSRCRKALHERDGDALADAILELLANEKGMHVYNPLPSIENFQVGEYVTATTADGRYTVVGTIKSIGLDDAKKPYAIIQPEGASAQPFGFSLIRRVSHGKPAEPAPVPYVPKVGDVVTWGAGEHVYRVEPDGHLRGCDKRWSGKWFANASAIDDLRPATASERAAAGLPVDEATTPPAAALTEEELRELARVLRDAKDEWQTKDIESELSTHQARAAAAWFAKRDGTVKP